MKFTNEFEGYKDKFKEFQINAIGEVLRAGGDVVSPEHYAERIKICVNCPNAGKVRPLPWLKTEGCTLCGCPFATKPKTVTHFDKDQKKIVKTTCPDVVNRWAEVDKKYFT